MGDTGYTVNLDSWRLEVAGRVGTPLSLTYSQIIGLSPFERNVLLICPGFFAYVGRWKGISVRTLIEKAQMQKDVTHVVLSTTRAAGGNEEKFPIADILSDKVFLAFGVNGQALPKKHGFPLRVVAEGYHGLLIAAAMLGLIISTGYGVSHADGDDLFTAVFYVT
jgi:sulfoxide reductase catalytic subunit YedY